MNVLTEGNISLENNLRVLIVGNFACGKSTLLNALLGHTLLNVRPIPLWDGISEIVYSEEPEVVLSKANADENDDKRCSFKITNSNESRRLANFYSNLISENSKTGYNKITIKFPLNICKNGVVFLEVPSSNFGSDNFDYPYADTILFCMRSTNALTSMEKFEIRKLISHGYKSIIFVLTYFDVVKYNDEVCGTNEAEEIKNYYTSELSKYTELGENGVFFVGSFPALRSKIKRDSRFDINMEFSSFEHDLNAILLDALNKKRLDKLDNFEL